MTTASTDETYYTMTSLQLTGHTMVMTTQNSSSSSSTELPYGEGNVVHGLIVTVYVYFWVVVAIIPVGLVCNSLAIIVCLGSKQIRRTTTGHYMVALSVADLIYLGGEIVRILNMNVFNHYITGINFMDEYDIACKSTYFVRYIGQFTCAWLTVTITAERCVTIALPLKVASLSTIGKTKILISVIFTLGIVLPSYTLWTIGIDGFDDGNRYCMFLGNGKAYEHWTLGVIILGSILVPCCLVFILTGYILSSLYRAHHRRFHQMMEGQGQSQYRAAAAAASSLSSTLKVEKQLTVTLLAVAVAFLVLRTPYIVTYFAKEYQIIHMPNDYHLDMILYICNKAADCLAIINYDVNFFLYCLCGSVFRRQLISQCRSCWLRASRKQVDPNKRPSVMTMNTYQSVRSRSSLQSSYQSLNNVKRRDTTDFTLSLAAATRYSVTCDHVDAVGVRGSSSPSPNNRRSLSPSSQLSLLPQVAVGGKVTSKQLQQRELLSAITAAGLGQGKEMRSRHGSDRQGRALSDSMLTQT